MYNTWGLGSGPLAYDVKRSSKLHSGLCYKIDILSDIGIKGPLCAADIQACGLVRVAICREAGYRHSGAMGSNVQGDIVEGNQSILPDIQRVN